MHRLPRTVVDPAAGQDGPEGFIYRHLDTFRGVAALVLILVLGSVGFKLIEGDSWSWLDAIYMAIITTSTVGFAEVRELSETGRIFAIAVIVFGVSAFVYTFATLGEYMVSGQVLGDFKLRRARRMLDNISGHYVLVGYGSTGAIAAKELSAKSDGEIVVIDQDREAVDRAVADGYLAIVGDAGRDEALLQAGVERAASLMCVAAPDSEAVMTVLTARSLAPELQIVARATLPDTTPKLLLAGATSVVSAHDIAGDRIAEHVISTSVSGFVDIELHGQSLELRWGECELAENSGFIGRTLEEASLNSALDADVVAIRKGGEQTFAVARKDDVLDAGDVLVVMGLQSQVDEALNYIGESGGM